MPYQRLLDGLLSVEGALGALLLDAMGEVGRRMPVEFRETALGGLAATPTGRRVKQQMHPESQGF